MAVDKNKIVAEATRFVQKGQYDKALRAYEKILAEDKKEVRTLLKVGEIQQKKGDGAAAAATFNQVAEIYGEQGFFLKAVAVYKQIAKLTPDDVRVNEKLAGLYQQLGLLNDATNQLQVVAAAHERAGDQGRHLDVLRRLLDLDPENVVTCQRLGDLYAKASRAPEALELYRRAAAHLRENKRGDEYLKLAERIYALTPDDLALARELAQEYLARGDTKKALGKLQVCHGADKQDADTLRLMAQAFRDLGQVSKTIAVYRALARVYAERGRRDEAALTWRMVLELLPDDPEAKDELAASEAAAPGAARSSGLPPAPRSTPAAPRPPPSVAPPRPVLTPSAPGPTPVPGFPAGTPTPAAAGPAAPPPLRTPTPAPVAPARTPAPRAAAGAPVGAAAVARVLTETDVYLKYGLHQKALDHVVRILETEPENPDALERVRDIRDAMGDRAGAAEAAERTVRALLEGGDEARIAHATERLRQLDPSHAEVGAEVPEVVPSEAPAAPATVVIPPPLAEGDLPPPDEEAVPPGGEPEAVVPAGEPVLAIPPDEDRPGLVSGPEGPAPVMDDEAPSAIGAYAGVPLDEAPPPAAPLPPEPEEPAPALVLGDDSPLPVDDAGIGIEVELESRSDDEAPLEIDVDTVPEEFAQAEEPPTAGPGEPDDAEEVEAEAVEVVEPPPVRATPTPPPLPVAAPPGPEREWESLDAELDEVEFYERQGLLDEALLAIRELADSHPGHPAVGPVLARIEAVAVAASDEAPPVQAARPSASPARPPSPPPVPSASPPRPGATSTGTTGIFDLGAELSAELGPELTPTPTGEFQYSVADVFDQFKKGLEKTVRPDDSSTKYDLGIAFQEMGMLDEALEQFRSALAGGDRKREVEILSMIGSCLGLKGEHAEAIGAYRQALASEFLTGEGAKALHFELGAAHEAIGDVEQAIWYFQKVAQGDPSYRGVADRVAHLGGGQGVAPGARAAHRPGPSGKKPRKR